MLHPSRCCARGIHIRTEIRPGVKRCVWCGSLELIAAPTPSAKNNTMEILTALGIARPEPVHDTTELETRFRKCAQAYAEKSAALVHWKQSGNTLPEVYR